MPCILLHESILTICVNILDAMVDGIINYNVTFYVMSEFKNAFIMFPFLYFWHY